MSVYFHQRANGELLRVPYAVSRDLAEVPASAWTFACNACHEEALCAECRANAAAQAEPPRRRHRLRFWRKERSA